MSSPVTYVRRLYQSLLGRIPLPAVDAERFEGLHVWRRHVLAALLLAGSLFGALAYLTNLAPVLQAGQWTLAGIYTAAYAWVLIITFARRPSFFVRAASLLFLYYGLGLVAMLAFGLPGDGRLWLLAFSMMATVLLGLQAGLGALALSVITLAVIGGLSLTGRLAPDVPLDPNSVPTWISVTAILFLLGIMGSLSLAMVTRGLDQSLKKERGLIDELEQERAQLRQRTYDLERRLTQIRSASEISRALSGVLDLEALLRQVVRLLNERAQLQYVGAFMLEPSGEAAVLRAAAGPGGASLPDAGLRVPADRSNLIGLAIAERRARLAESPAAAGLALGRAEMPAARSALALPLLRRDNVLGALVVLSEQADAFDRDDVTVMQGIADGLAIALENARLIQELQESLDEIRDLHRQYLTENWSERNRNLSDLSYTFEAEPTAAAGGELLQIRVPLMLRRQEIGQVTLEADRAEWSAEDLALIETITAQAAVALENARLFEESRRRAHQERVVAEITAKVRASTDVESIVRTAIGELGRALNATEGVIRLGTSTGTIHGEN